MEIESYAEGTPCWVDLGTPDLDAACTFYSGLFGWEIERGGPETGHYSMARVDGREVAALADAQVPGVVAWQTYLAVDDLDAAVGRAAAHGAQVLVEPMAVMTAGRMAVLADPGGAAVSFWEAGEYVGAGRVDEPGCTCWHELTTRAVEESVAFYGAVVGLRAERTGDDPADYVEWHRGDGPAVGGLMPMVGDIWPADLPNHWMVYFAVEDADATAARCAELGGQVSVPPTDIAQGRFAVLNDPQGAFFSIIRLAA